MAGVNHSAFGVCVNLGGTASPAVYVAWLQADNKGAVANIEFKFSVILSADLQSKLLKHLAKTFAKPCEAVLGGGKNACARRIRIL